MYGAERRAVRCTATPGKMMAHATWLRLGRADAPGSPFHELGLEQDAVSVDMVWTRV